MRGRPATGAGRWFFRTRPLASWSFTRAGPAVAPVGAYATAALFGNFALASRKGSHNDPPKHCGRRSLLPGERDHCGVPASLRCKMPAPGCSLFARRGTPRRCCRIVAPATRKPAGRGIHKSPALSFLPRRRSFYLPESKGCHSRIANPLKTLEP